jgi:hypothetical protein
MTILVWQQVKTPARRVECEIVHFFFNDRRCDKRANSEKDFTIEA